jgi:hypothetical protein
MLRLLALATALLGLAASPALAQVDCAPGAYSGPNGEVLALTRPEGAPGARYTFVDGRRGFVTDEAALARCVDGKITVRASNGASQVWARMNLRLTPTKFKSGDLTLNGLLVEPPPRADGKAPPLVVLVHGSERTAAVTGNFYSYILAGQGVATFVYDKRGTGGSTGTYTQNFEWLADDVVAASAEAKRLAAGRHGRFGLFGGSQGGWVAPLAANRAGAQFVAVGFGLVLSPLEEDAEQVFDELRRKGYGAEAIAEARQVTDAVGAVVASGFTTGFDRLAEVRRQYGERPWFGQIQGEFTGEVLKGDEAALRVVGPQRIDNLNLIWRYDAVAALRAVPVPQLWIMAGEDTAAPGSLSRDRLAKLRHEGRPIEVYVFPKTDHGIYEYVETPDGSRKMTRIADGYLRLLADWIKQDLKPPYGAAERRD